MSSGKDHPIVVPIRRMNMAIIIPSLDKYGGAERYVIECVRHWQARHAITIYATSFNERLLQESGIEPSVRLVSLTAYFEGDHSFLLNAVLLPKLWRQQIERHDVYHTHLWPTHLIDLHPMVWFPHEPFRALHDLRFEIDINRTDQSQIASIHVYPKYNYDSFDTNLHDAYMAAIGGHDTSVITETMIANSGYTSAYLARVYGCQPPPVVYPGVDSEAALALPMDSNLFVTIGQLWHHKRINLLIEAIAMTDQAQLIVIGSGPEQPRLELLSQRLGVDDRVFFLSDLDHFELRLVLARACAFVFSPIKEPFGIVVLEAMAAGKPIIAVDEGGYTEVCHPDFSFLIPASPLRFSETMAFLRDNPEIAARMGRAARNAVAPFTWEKTASELEHILINACRPAPPPLPAPVRPLVGIQYYLWYGDGFGGVHWNDNAQSGHVSDHPFIGFYDSSSGQTIEYHLSQFELMKLDYVILNLHVDELGPNENELHAIRHLFEIARESGSPIRLAIQISAYNADPARLRTIVELIANQYAHRDEYFKLNDRPVLFWFWTTAYDGDVGFFDVVAPAVKSFANLGLGLRMAKGAEESRATFGFFSGYAPFSPLELASEENWKRVWTAAYQASALAAMPIKMVTASPGYDDHQLGDPRRAENPYRTIERRDGAVFQFALEFAADIQPAPDLIVISTYNEYHENSHIEQSLKNGDKYIKMTREFTDRIRSRFAEGFLTDD